MQVNKITGEVPCVDAVAAPKAQGNPAVDVPPDATAPARRADEVEISVEGRALAGHAADSTTDFELGAARLADIRGKLDSGAYLTHDAADQVARAILQRGDL